VLKELAKRATDDGSTDETARNFTRGASSDYAQSLEDYKKEYNEIFDRLLDRGKVIEINTKRMHLPNAYDCLLEIYQGYYDRGGRYITIGSDTHEAGEIGVNINIAEEMAQKIGLVPVHFMERRMCV
jgi:histidinol-phosphatase (PHP family)